MLHIWTDLGMTCRDVKQLSIFVLGHVPSSICLTWYVSDPIKSFLFTPGVRPFPCPHCDKIFRTSGHRKTHIASHFKNSQQKKHKFPRKSNKAKVSKSNLPLPDIPLQEPILITDFGKITPQIKVVLAEFVPLLINQILQRMWDTKGGALPFAFNLSFTYSYFASRCSHAICSHYT